MLPPLGPYFISTLRPFQSLKAHRLKPVVLNLAHEKEIKTKDIQPKIIYDMIDSKDDNIIHLTLNE
jgi:hypothetical protein